MADPKDVDVTIRAAEASDIEALADLMIQLGYEGIALAGGLESEVRGPSRTGISRALDRH
jgi:hypothetical protein